MGTSSYPQTLYRSGSVTHISSSSTSMKVKKLLRVLIVAFLRKTGRVMSRCQNLLEEYFRDPSGFSFRKTKKEKHGKMYLGSFRLHYNWNPSHVLPAPVESVVLREITGLYLDSFRASGRRLPFPTVENPDSLSGYLNSLEEKVPEKMNYGEQVNCNDINLLAENFIKTFRQQFLLEKQASSRRWREMMDRGS